MTRAEIAARIAEREARQEQQRRRAEIEMEQFRVKSQALTDQIRREYDAIVARKATASGASA